MRKRKKSVFLTIILLLFLLFSSKSFLNKVSTGVFVGNINGHDKQTFELKNYNSESIYIYNLTEEKEVAGLNESERRYPASLVKIMTVYVALQEIQDINGIAPIDTDSYKRLVRENSSMAGFVGKEKTTYKDLLYGALLASGGECAESLAINVSGNIESFVEKMNKQSASFSLENTNFTNVTGMDEKGQYSTAKDIAMMLKECLKNRDFYSVFSSPNYVSTHTLDHPDGLYIESTVFKKLYNFNSGNFRIIGGKSGTTSMAGLCWATLAVKDGKEYIVVVMGTPFENISNPGDGHIIDTLKILERI